jgi:hypothetical protein
MKDVLMILMGVFFLLIPYFVVYIDKKSIWKALLYGTFIWIAIAVLVPTAFFLALYIFRCADWVSDGSANWYQSIIGYIVYAVQIIFVGGCFILGGGGTTTHTGPRGGEYHYSKNGNSKIYTTNS